MRTLWITANVVLALLAGWGTARLMQTREALGEIKEEKRFLAEQNAKLSALNDSLSAENGLLAREREQEAAIAVELRAALAAAEQTPEQAVAPIERPQPFRVRAYLGRELLGEAWLVPSNFEQDPRTGRVSYEPVLMLEEKHRKQFTIYETNYVTQPVATEVTYNYNYIPPRTYYYPVYYPVGRSRPHPQPAPPAQPTGPTFPTMPARGSTTGGSPWGSVWAGTR